MEISIRKFSALTTGQLYDILQLRSEIFVVEQQCIYNDLDGLDKDATHMIIQEFGLTIATARILPAGIRFPQVSIGRVVVHQAYRGRDYGKILMRRAIQYATEAWNAVEIKISAQLYLKKFYEELGFMQVTDVYDEDGIPHIGMIWSP